MTRPDYKSGSIVNLMTSLLNARGEESSSLYPPLPQIDPSRLEAARTVVLLVIDGLGYEYLIRRGTGGHLHRYLAGKITSVFPSTTATAVTTFLTGTAPQQHALTGWFMYFRELGCVTAVLPFTARHGGRSLRKGGIDPSALFGHTSVFDRIKGLSYGVVPQRISGSDFNQSHAGRSGKRPYRSLTSFFKNLEELISEDRRRKYIYAYWPDLDRLAHKHGIGSRQAEQHLARWDEAFGRFLSSIRGSDTILIVTADHGFIDTDPSELIEVENHPELSRTLMLPLCGEPRVAYCYVHPDRQDRFEAYVREVLAGKARLYRSEQLIAEGYFGLGPPHPRLSERVGQYTLIMEDHLAIKDWVMGEKKHLHRGIHGGLTDEEVYVPLIVADT